MKTVELMCWKTFLFSVMTNISGLLKISKLIVRIS